MEKREFRLDDEDFNRIVEISANENELLQIYNGCVKKYSKAERSDHFWESISIKYGFNPHTVETELPDRNRMYFLAEPVKYENEKPVNQFCSLCHRFTGPQHIGCDRSNEMGCIWNKIRQH